jgi:D-alanyl-lipoteichoic acid acyltransferase DltB (MBOAT superfamily)
MLTSGIDQHLISGLAVAAAFSLAFIAFPWLERIKCVWLLSLVAAACYYWREFLGFVLISAIGYIVVYWLSRETSPARRWRWACVSMFALVFVFTCGRIQHWDRPWVFPIVGPMALFSLGMWPALKLVTLLWEVGSNSVAAPSLSQYLIWTCLPFTLGGPILRWSQMPSVLLADPRVLTSAAWWRGAGAATAKLMVGVSLGLGQQSLTSHWPQAHFWNNAAATFVSGPIGFYLTLAGYFQWMELLGRPCGIKLPESFNFPIGRENISAFWMNWNITATYVFRDYVFYNRWGRRTYNVYFNVILLFTLVGLWHATNAYWILWGFLHGLLFATFLLWRKFGTRLRNLPLRGTLVSRTSARVLTYFSVCMCWYLPSKIIQKLAGAW